MKFNDRAPRCLQHEGTGICSCPPPRRQYACARACVEGRVTGIFSRVLDNVRAERTRLLRASDWAACVACSCLFRSSCRSALAPTSVARPRASSSSARTAANCALHSAISASRSRSLWSAFRSSMALVASCACGQALWDERVAILPVPRWC